MIQLINKLEVNKNLYNLLVKKKNLYNLKSLAYKNIFKKE